MTKSKLKFKSLLAYFLVAILILTTNPNSSGEEDSSAIPNEPLKINITIEWTYPDLIPVGGLVDVTMKEKNSDTFHKKTVSEETNWVAQFELDPSKEYEKPTAETYGFDTKTVNRISDNEYKVIVKRLDSEEHLKHWTRLKVLILVDDEDKPDEVPTLEEVEIVVKESKFVGNVSTELNRTLTKIKKPKELVNGYWEVYPLVKKDEETYYSVENLPFSGSYAMRLWEVGFNYGLIEATYITDLDSYVDYGFSPIDTPWWDLDPLPVDTEDLQYPDSDEKEDTANTPSLESNPQDSQNNDASSSSDPDHTNANSTKKSDASTEDHNASQQDPNENANYNTESPTLTSTTTTNATASSDSSTASKTAPTTTTTDSTPAITTQTESTARYTQPGNDPYGDEEDYEYVEGEEYDLEEIDENDPARGAGKRRKKKTTTATNETLAANLDAVAANVTALPYTANLPNELFFAVGAFLSVLGLLGIFLEKLRL